MPEKRKEGRYPSRVKDNCDKTKEKSKWNHMGQCGARSQHLGSMGESKPSGAVDPSEPQQPLPALKELYSMEKQGHCLVIKTLSAPPISGHSSLQEEPPWREIYTWEPKVCKAPCTILKLLCPDGNIIEQVKDRNMSPDFSS
ncbi:unnamed protein product [Pleuronectes platessa]|uniref:Uncharacterized protein n=1 Tax=Pleuronectes platessa TaxID=8262 RepID=A0A9N7UFH9_PLEPL|nr:unnamed protein product [Pleuronectes platessa]